MSSPEANQEPVYLWRDGAIGWLTLNRPDKLNALSWAMWDRIRSLLADAAADRAIKVVVLHGGEAKAFAAGADIAEFETAYATPESSAAYAKSIYETGKALGHFPKPTIAMIRGACVGGGCGLAMACDLRFATPSAKFGITPAKLGIAYGLQDTKRLVDAVGPAKAKDILYTGRIMDAQEALAIGLIDRLIAEDDLLEDTIGYVGEITAVSQFSTRATKRVVQMILDGVDDDTPETQALFVSSFEGEDFKEGTRAFLEKRKPTFTYS